MVSKRANGGVSVESWIYGTICSLFSVSRFRLLREKVGQEKSDLLCGSLGGKSEEIHLLPVNGSGSEEFASYTPHKSLDVLVTPLNVQSR